MKALLRKIVRTVARWPGVGRLVRIGVAVIRLPELRDGLEYVSRAQALRPAGATVASDYQVFQSEQLPTILQALSDVNHRQLIEVNGQNNLTRSVPVSLRKMTREIVQLREKDSHLQAALHEQSSRLQTTLDEHNTRLQAELQEHQKRLMAQMIEAGVAIGDRMAQMTGQIEQFGAHVHASLESQVTAAVTQQAGTVAQVSQLAESVGYLLGRVEFVRRELMFEMRYGATPTGQMCEELAVKTKILAVDKVALARQAGIRLNIGCGHVPLDGYVNVDRRALPGVDVVAEADQLPFEINEVAEICSTHLLEHFPLEQLRRELLPYWVSLLRSNGVFRAVVPDGAGMARAYASNEYSFEALRKVTYGGQDYDGDFHFNMFSVESLSQLLHEAGFTSIEVIAENRENGGCKEFEIVARR